MLKAPVYSVDLQELPNLEQLPQRMEIYCHRRCPVLHEVPSAFFFLRVVCNR